MFIPTDDQPTPDTPYQIINDAIYPDEPINDIKLFLDDKNSFDIVFYAISSPNFIRDMVKELQLTKNQTDFIANVITSSHRAIEAAPQLEAIDTAIEALKAANLDTSSLEAQKAALLDVVSGKSGQSESKTKSRNKNDKSGKNGIAVYELPIGELLDDIETLKLATDTSQETYSNGKFSSSFAIKDDKFVVIAHAKMGKNSELLDKIVETLQINDFARRKYKAKYEPSSSLLQICGFEERRHNVAELELKLGY